MALLISACGFTEPRKFVIINENCDIDASFLITSLIGQRLRQQNSGNILICCHQSLKYYETCGKKLGYNLNMGVSKKNFIAIERIRDASKLSSMNSQPSHLLNELYDEIKIKVDEFKSNGMKNISVIIDDLTFFSYFGCSEKELLTFCLNLHQLTVENTELSIILKIGLSDLHQYLKNNIENLSDVSITVEKLKSGDFWDVDGKISIKKIKCINGFYQTESERSLLYHVGDHNVKIIAPGEHGLKI